MSDERSLAFAAIRAQGMEQVPQEVFDDLYARFEDPWDLDGRWYEERKRALTVAALPRQRYRRGFEPGCSVGALTERLAPRCDRLLAVDAAAAAVTRARRRVAGYPGVEVERLRLPDEWPEPSFDLVVLSEILYFASGARLSRLVDGVVSLLEPGGHVVAVHYRPSTAVHASDGDEVHARLREEAALAPIVEHVESEFRLDVLERLP